LIGAEHYLAVWRDGTMPGGHDKRRHQASRTPGGAYRPGLLLLIAVCCC
jgi:hypothetical protein